jgi:hypothetical protein
MALKSGHGGSIKVAGTTTVPTDKWSANWRVRLAEVTQSDSGGATLYLGVVEDNEWTWEAARDDTNYPEALGLSPGYVISDLRFKLGAGSSCDKLVNTTIETVDPVVDNKGDVVRVTIRGKGGKLTANTTF